MRTLTGHKSSVRSLDFHPYGDYAASGSLDCNIKVKLFDLMDHHKIIYFKFGNFRVSFCFVIFLIRGNLQGLKFANELHVVFMAYSISLLARTLNQQGN